MDRRNRTSRRALALAFVVLVLAGCDDAVTVHSLSDLDDPTQDAEALVGAWQETSEGELRLRIEENDALGSDLAITATGTRGQDPFLVADDFWLFELGGHLLAETRVPVLGQAFFRQYLVKTGEQRIEVCGGLPVWIWIERLAKGHAAGYSLDALDYTDADSSDDESFLVFVSGKDAMRAVLTSALPELAAACDKGDGESLPKWVVFERMSPEEEQAAAVATVEAAAVAARAAAEAAAQAAEAAAAAAAALVEATAATSQDDGS